MKDQERKLLDSFLGFSLLDWLDGLSTDELLELCRLLLHLKLANWAMIRSLTNILDRSQELRDRLPPDQQQDFLAVEASIRKPASEALVWIYGVAYIFLRNCVELLHRQGEAHRRLPALARLIAWEKQRLQVRLSGPIFKNTLVALAAHRKEAYGCYTSLGSKTLALALHGLSDDACYKLLRGAVSRGFIKDVMQLRSGSFLVFSALNVLKARDELISVWAASQSPAQPNLETVMFAAIELPPAQRHRCLYTANLIDIGIALKDLRRPSRLMPSLQEKLHPVYMRLLYAAAAGKLKINRAEARPIKTLAVEVLRSQLQNHSQPESAGG